jgi:hypothetical protein
MIADGLAAAEVRLEGDFLQQARWIDGRLAPPAVALGSPVVFQYAVKGIKATQAIGPVVFLRGARIAQPSGGEVPNSGVIMVILAAPIRLEVLTWIDVLGRRSWAEVPRRKSMGYGALGERDWLSGLVRTVPGHTSALGKGVMSILRRKSLAQGPLATHDLVSAMARFGRFEYDPQASDEDASWIYENIIAPLHPSASAYPARFVELLEREVSGEGGWESYGAAHAVWELLTSDQLSDLKGSGSYNAVIDASLAFLQRNGVPPNRVTGHKWSHWIGRGGTVETWISPRELPTLQSAFIRPLRDNEMRSVARLSDAGDANVILVRAHPGGRYVAVIDAHWSDEDPRRVQNDWQFAHDLYGLYIKIGRSLQVPPPWHDQEIEPFFPLPVPKI